MSAHYSKFYINTYCATPYFRSQIPKDYPLQRVLIKCQAFKHLPENLKKLSGLAKEWACRQYPYPAGIEGIEKWYNDAGEELNPGTGEVLTDAQITESWEHNKNNKDDLVVEDIPEPPGGFAHPDDWEVPQKEPDLVDRGHVTEENIAKYVRSRGIKATAEEYGVPAHWIPEIKDNTALYRAIMSMHGKPWPESPAPEPAPEPRAASALAVETPIVTVNDRPNKSGKKNVADDYDEKNMPKKIGVSTDWDELKIVMVGCCENDAVMDEDGVKAQKDQDKRMHKRAVNQLENLCEVLESEGAKIYCPEALTPEEAEEEPAGLCQAHVRSAFTVFGTRLVVNQLCHGHRAKDREALESFLQALERNGLCTIHRMPPCSLEEIPDGADSRAFLDGADVFRLGKDVLVTISGRASSEAGAAWLKDLLEPDGVSVWPAFLTDEWERGDSVFMPVREGLCVSFVKGFVDGILPTPCTDWTCIPITRDEAENCFVANSIVLRENTVLIPKGNNRLLRALERKGVDVIELDASGLQFWQGGIRACTAELYRD